jgi:hypothetical protein
MGMSEKGSAMPAPEWQITPSEPELQTQEYLEQQWQQKREQQRDLVVDPPLIGRVQRLVPGKLLYVEFKPNKAFPFKLDLLMIKQPDGTFCSYGGEPFSQLGLNVGSTVLVMATPERSANVVFDPSNQPSKPGVFRSIPLSTKDFFRR